MDMLRNQESSLVAYVFLFLLSCHLIPKAVAQPPNTANEFQYARLSPPLAIIIIVLIAALFFMAAFSIYIRHCTQSAGMSSSVRRALSLRRRAAAAARGLDAAVIETFPTFTYAEVKDHQVGKGALECAVCLNEFEDDETLRLIPKCDHVFHPECIDAWLESHDTCPVCRANLNPQPGEPPAAQVNRDEPRREQQQQNDEVSIRIASDEEQQQEQVQRQEEEGGSVRTRVKRALSFNVPNRAEGGSVKAGVKRNSSFNVSIQPPRSISMKPRIFSKFRSHSTGHSLVLPGENLDRYTLRLPEGVRREVMNRALLNRAKSFGGTLPSDTSSKRGYRTGAGDGSSRGARSNKRIERSEPEAKSDRWVFTIAPPFFSRGSSMKSPRVGAEAGEGSTSGSVKSAVKLPSFKCLEPKAGDEASLISADSARPPV